MSYLYRNFLDVPVSGGLLQIEYAMWSNMNSNINRPLLLITAPSFPPTNNVLPRFENELNYASPRRTVHVANRNVADAGVPKQQSVTSAKSDNSSPAKSTRPSVDANESVSNEQLLKGLEKFENMISTKLDYLLNYTRKVERRVITTIGANIDASNEKYIQNKQLFVDFGNELKEDFSRIESEQENLHKILKLGLNEIKYAFESACADEGVTVDPTIVQLAPKFDVTYRIQPTCFLKQFDIFVQNAKITSSIQRLLFIHCVQLDNPVWRERIANVGTYEGLKESFLNLTWSRKHQMLVYLEFEKASFKDLTPEQVDMEAKKWCDIVKDMEDVDFKSFRVTLLEKLPRHWQATLRVFALNDFESLIRNINSCFQNESVIPTYNFITNQSRREKLVH